jgi:hypothetical protein
LIDASVGSPKVPRLIYKKGNVQIAAAFFHFNIESKKIALLVSLGAAARLQKAKRALLAAET